ncbi:Cullin repeat-like-containing domain protein [Mycena epipterygia]|nr:Cullin repeat-like-containing domain protein [Mycena epipterygia]
MAHQKLNWETQFEPGLTRMLTLTSHSYSEYIVIYTQVYNVGAQPGGSQDLYEHVVRYFEGFTTKIRDDAPGADLVEYYDAKWDVFSAGVVYIDRAFTYINRHYVRAEQTNGNTNIDTVLNVSLKSWKDNVLEPLASRLRDDLQDQAVRVDEVLATFDGKSTPDDFKNMRLRQALVADI